MNPEGVKPTMPSVCRPRCKRSAASSVSRLKNSWQPRANMDPNIDDLEESSLFCSNSCVHPCNTTSCPWFTHVCNHWCMCTSSEKSMPFQRPATTNIETETSRDSNSSIHLRDTSAEDGPTSCNETMSDFTRKPHDKQTTCLELPSNSDR